MPQRPARPRQAWSAMSPARAGPSRCPWILLDIPERAYMSIVCHLDVLSLCKVDAACRLTRTLNGSDMGPWLSLGRTDFMDIELHFGGAFERGRVTPSKQAVPRADDWKSQYLWFMRLLPTFASPYSGREVTRITQPDQVARCRCMLVQDAPNVYLEILVTRNPDNLSIAVVDCDDGEDASLTFSPDTGAVIRSQKLSKNPVTVEETYIDPLPTLPEWAQGFLGHIAIYVHNGNFAFLRRSFPRKGVPHSMTRWQTTGYVADFSWAESRRVVPCVAFRDEGDYAVRILRFGRCDPPIPLGPPPASYDLTSWIPLDVRDADLTS